MKSLRELARMVTPACAWACGIIGFLLLLQPKIHGAVGTGFILASVSIWLAWRQRNNWEKALRPLTKLGLLAVGGAYLPFFHQSEDVPPIVAIGFVIAAIALLVHYLSGGRNQYLSRALSYLVFALAWAVAIGYVYGAPMLMVGPAGHSVVSVLIVTGFLVLSLGLVGVHAQDGLPALLVQGNLTAFQFRTLLPAVLLLPFLVGLLVLQGLPLYGPHMAVALTVIGSALIATLILMVSMEHLRSAERKLRETLRLMDEARVAAESANNERDRFVSFMSHELRAPLSSALAWIDLMELKPDEQNIRDGIRVVKESISSMVRLIDDLGDIAQLNKGKLVVEHERIDLRNLLRKICQEMTLQLSDREIRLHQDLPDFPCLMMGDPIRIQQVFRNLLSNAEKYVQPGGWVRVHLQTDGHQAAVTVTDNGVGLTPEQCEQIFEPFNQIDSNRRGLGVGLAIAKAIMKAHDGSISVSSEGVGKGCIFTLQFPIISSQPDSSVSLLAQ